MSEFAVVSDNPFIMLRVIIDWLNLSLAPNVTMAITV